MIIQGPDVLVHGFRWAIVRNYQSFWTALTGLLASSLRQVPILRPQHCQFQLVDLLDQPVRVDHGP